MPELLYLKHYPASIVQQVEQLLVSKKLGEVLAKRYPQMSHQIQTDQRLYEFTMQVKQQFMKSTPPLSKVCFDNKIQLSNALGTHSQISRVQGRALKSKNEIRIASLLKKLPEPLLRMLVVHELAHFREKDHNKAFYQLCVYMEPAYHQLELDLRLFLTWQSFDTGDGDATN